MVGIVRAMVRVVPLGRTARRLAERGEGSRWIKQIHHNT